MNPARLGAKAHCRDAGIALRHHEFAVGSAKPVHHPGDLDTPILGIMADLHGYEGDAVEADGEVRPGGECAAGLAREYPLQRIALLRIGAIIDEEPELAVLVEHAPLKMDDEHHCKIAIQPDVAELPLTNEPGENAFAKAMGGLRPEDAGAANGAVAQVPPVALDAPVGGRFLFRALPCGSFWCRHGCPVYERQVFPSPRQAC
jgi:hypothetical protein